MRYVIGVDGSVDAAQLSWIVVDEGLVPVGVPGTVGGVESGGGSTLIVADAALWALALVRASTASTV